MNAAHLHAIDSSRATTITRARRGLPRVEGIEWVDDEGAWYPLGGTLFWALRGWKYDRRRLQTNLQYLADYAFDYVRILGHVEWSGNDIDWRWALTPEVLGEFLDYAYSLGLRTELTLLGTYSDRVDLDAVCEQATAIINTGGAHRVLDLECCNEAYQNGVNGDLGILRHMARRLRGAGLVNILGLSSCEHAEAYGLTWDDIRAGAMLTDGANVQPVHTDRGEGDDDYRMVRQPYDFRDLPFAVCGNEPPGPASSVNELRDPSQLAMLRVNGICHGIGAWVLHNGAGVAGQVDPYHDRPANLWETPPSAGAPQPSPEIDAIMAAVRGVDAFLPPNAGTGRHYNNQQENPCRVTEIWPDTPSGANRRYCVEHADGFVAVSFAVTNQASYVCRRRCQVEIFDPVAGLVDTRIVEAGATLGPLTPTTRDPYGHGNYILRGTWA